MADLPDADVAIVGAGPVGSALALLLARRGLRTTLLERSAFPRDKPCGEGLMPSGVAVLEELGIDLDAMDFPRHRGVRYRLPGEGSVLGAFRDGDGRGVRRLRLDAMLAERAAADRRVSLRTECPATGIERGDGHVRVETSKGALLARFAVGADGLRSRVRSWMGWSAAPAPPHRHALVGHLEAPCHGLDEIVVSILERVELYVAPTGPDELLAIAMGPRGSLREPGLSVAETYGRILARAHPEYAGAPWGHLQGVGPFRVTPRQVAAGRVFLVGDAAGFIDPLTGDAMSAGLVAARRLAALLAEEPGTAASGYRRWHAAQWRRRRWLSAIALRLTGSRQAARRAIAGARRRPAALTSLLEVNAGTRQLWQVSPLDWAALAGL